MDGQINHTTLIRQTFLNTYLFKHRNYTSCYYCKLGLRVLLLKFHISFYDVRPIYYLPFIYKQVPVLISTDNYETN